MLLFGRVSRCQGERAIFYDGVRASFAMFSSSCVCVCVCVTVRNSSATRITTKFSATKLFFPLVFKYEFTISSFASIFLYYDEVGKGREKIEKIWVNCITLFLNLVTRTLYLYLVRNKSYELWAFVNWNVHSYRKSIALLEFFFFLFLSINYFNDHTPVSCPSLKIIRVMHKNVRRFKVSAKILSVFCMFSRFETCSRSTFAQVIGKFRLQRTETGRQIPMNLDKLAYILILWRSNCKGSFCHKKRVVSIPKNPFSIQETILIPSENSIYIAYLETKFENLMP